MMPEPWPRFEAWMNEHDTGPGSITVGQVAREFQNLSFETICIWIGIYRGDDEMRTRAEALIHRDIRKRGMT